MRDRCASMLLTSLCLGILLTGRGKAPNSGENTAPVQATKQDAKELTFVLDWTPNTNHTSAYVTREKGYFKDAGLGVEIVRPSENGAEVLAASGKAQFTIPFQDSLAPTFSGGNPFPVAAVVGIIQYNTSSITPRRGEDMGRPKGLEGKEYVTWDLSVEKATVKDVMETDEGDFGRVGLIPSTVTDEVMALKTKSVGAIRIFCAWAGVKTELEGLKIDYFVFTNLNPVFDFYTPVIIANSTFLAEEPETTRAFLDTVGRGYEFAIKHPRETGGILCKAALELDPNLVKASQEYLTDKYRADAPQ